MSLGLTLITLIHVIISPTQSEPPFAITEVAVLLVFVALAVLAGIRFHPPSTRAGGAQSVADAAAA